MPARLRSPVASTLALDADAAPTLQQRVFGRLRELIESGSMPAGARLPSTRVLAGELRVSRNTVLAAFERLAAEGYITARRGAGSFVVDTLPGTLVATTGGARPREAAATAHLAGAAPSHVALPRARPLPFSLDATPTEIFPHREWQRLLAHVWHAMSGRILAPADVAGAPELRQAIARYVSAARGVRASADQVLVVAGAQHGIDLVSRVLLRPDDAVWMEEPGYPGAHAAFRACGARVVPVPVDDGGMDVRLAIAQAPAPRLAFVTPARQFPLGAALGTTRRRALVDAVAGANGWLLEDDFDASFRFDSPPAPALQALAPERVIHVGSFSRTIAHALRLGYLVVPRVLVPRFEDAMRVGGAQASMLEQLVLARFMHGGGYDSHLRRLRTVCAERHAACRDALAEVVGPPARVLPSAGGTHLVLELCAGTDDVALARRLAAAGLQATALSPMFLGDARRSGLLLGYAGFRAPLLWRAARELGRVLGAGAADRPLRVSA